MTEDERIDPRAELPAPTDEPDAHGSDQQLPADERRDPGSEQRAPSVDRSTISQVNDSDREREEGSRSGDE
jgi:hypothetical protein